MSPEGIPELPDLFDKQVVLQKIEDTIDTLREGLGNTISDEIAQFYEEVLNVADSSLRSGKVVDCTSFLEELEFRKKSGKITEEVFDFIRNNLRD